MMETSAAMAIWTIGLERAALADETALPPPPLLTTVMLLVPRAR